MTYKEKFDKLVEAIEAAKVAAKVEYDEPYWEESHYAAANAKEIQADDLITIARTLDNA